MNKRWRVAELNILPLMFPNLSRCPFYPFGEPPIDTPESSTGGIWPPVLGYPAGLPLPHDSPCPLGFREASPLPTSGLSIGLDYSLTSASTRIAPNIEAQQKVHWTYPFSDAAVAEQSMEMLYYDEGERRASNSSGTTDSSYENTMNDLQRERWVPPTSATTDTSYHEDSMIDLNEKTQSLSLESHDTEATGSSNSAKPIDAWKDIQIFVASEGWLLVPQDLYQPRGETDKKKYVHTAKLLPPIYFYVKNPCELGIALDQAQLRRLEDGEDPVLEDCSGSISLRIQWPGYRPWKDQLHTRDYRRTPGPISKAKLAKNLAQRIHKFIDQMATRRMEADADPTWKIGSGRIKFEDLVLVSLHHVSQGSWQPQLRLRRQISGSSRIV